MEANQLEEGAAVPDAEATARAELYTAIKELKATQDRLLGVEALLPARDVETGPEDVSGEFEPATEMRLVAQCVAHDLKSAISSLEAAAAYPAEPEAEE